MKATKVILMLLLIVIMPITIADVNIDTAINVENGDLDYSSTVMTSGDAESNVNAVVNGDLVLQTLFHETENAYMSVDIDMNPSYYNSFTTVNQGDGYGLTFKYLKNNIKAVIDYLVDGKSIIPYRSEALEIVYHLSRFFATKQELNQMYMNDLELHYRLVAIERTLEKIAPDEYCESKLEVMRDYGLPSTNCGDWQYSVSQGRNDDDWIIGLKQVQIIVIPEQETETTEEEEPEDMTMILEALQYWDSLCDRGMQKWCLIAHENRVMLGLE